MAKKKKTQLKPIARGFATTSVPKKVVVQEPRLSEPETATPEGSVHDAEQSAEISKVEDHDSTSKDPLNALSTEDQFLQSFVERLQDKTEKEIARYFGMYLTVLNDYLYFSGPSRLWYMFKNMDGANLVVLVNRSRSTVFTNASSPRHRPKFTRSNHSKRARYD
jgi:hypothetical protein